MEVMKLLQLLMLYFATQSLAVAARYEEKAKSVVYDPFVSDLRFSTPETFTITSKDRDDDVDLQMLLANMTIRQKVAQMTQLDIYSMVDGDIRDPSRALKQDVVVTYAKAGIGSILNCPFSGPTDGRIGWTASEWRIVIDQIKAIYRQYSPVPMIYGIDTIHGATYVKGATLFGQPISVASSFNVDLVMRMGDIEAKDTLSAGIPWVFSPVLGIAVQPKWARVYETFGEDPYLSSVMGASIIRGIQSSGKVAACMKHFIGYSNPTSGLDRSDNVISDFELVNHYAPSFLAATRVGVKTAMESYISINGYPVIASHKLLTDLLRKDMNFTGMLVSDYSEIDRMHQEHHLVPTIAEAVRVSLNQTSLDMNMGPNMNDFLDTVDTLVKDNLLSETRLDESVMRILALKKDLGLFEEHRSNDTISNDDVDDVGSDADQQVALQLARESIILLENRDNMLPLDANSPNISIFITGPISNNKGYMCGGWSVYWQGSSNSSHFPNGKTFKDAMIARSNSSTNNLQIEHLDVVDVNGDMTPEDFTEGLKAAARNQYTIVLLGEGNYAEKTGDIADLSLPYGQRKYLEELTKISSTKVILVLIEGRPRLLHDAHKHADAVLLSMLPCEQGGEALADIIFGDANPSAKLPITYPKDSGKILPYYHLVNTMCQPWQECPVEWEFGYGLSYTTFNYSNFHLSSTQVNATNGSLQVGVTVTNAGPRDGCDVLLLFISQKYRLASVPEKKLLKKFFKLNLAANSSINAQFDLSPEDWSFYEPHIGEGFTLTAEPGEFTVSLLQSINTADQETTLVGDKGNGTISHSEDVEASQPWAKGRGGPSENGGKATESASVSKVSSLSATFYVVA